MKLGVYLRKFALVWLLVILMVSGVFIGAFVSVNSNADVGKTNSSVVYFDAIVKTEIHEPKWFESSPIDGYTPDRVKNIKIDGVKGISQGDLFQERRLKFNYSTAEGELVQSDKVTFTAIPNRNGIRLFAEPKISKSPKELRDLDGGSFSDTVMACESYRGNGVCSLTDVMTLKVTQFERVEKFDSKCDDDRSNYPVPIC